MPAMAGDISHTTNADEIKLEIQTSISKLPNPIKAFYS